MKQDLAGREAVALVDAVADTLSATTLVTPVETKVATAAMVATPVVAGALEVGDVQPALQPAEPALAVEHGRMDVARRERAALALREPFDRDAGDPQLVALGLGHELTQELTRDGRGRGRDGAP